MALSVFGVHVVFTIPVIVVVLMQMFTVAGTRHFVILDGRRGGGRCWCAPLGVSKLSIVELSGRNWRIAFGEYSRLEVRFIPLVKIGPVMRGQMSSFCLNRRFLNIKSP